MPTLSDQNTRPRSILSELDRRAISLAGHLLMGGVWLERRVGDLPKMLGTLATGNER